ncbi:hypothetical protein ABXI76_01030 [Streptomyces parvus]
MSPRPPYCVTNRTGRTTVKRLTAWTTAPSPMKLLGIRASAPRG